MNTFFYAYIIFFCGKLSAVFIILIESMNKIIVFGPLLYLFPGKVVQVSPCFTSVFLQIELTTLKFLVSQSYIGDGSSVSISETYAAKMFSLHTFKTFFNLPFAFQVWLCWVTPLILTGETPMLSRVELSSFFVDSYSTKTEFVLWTLSQIFLSCSHFQMV